jgi:hypothetical protein
MGERLPVQIHMNWDLKISNTSRYHVVGGQSMWQIPRIGHEKETLFMIETYLKLLSIQEAMYGPQSAKSSQQVSCN